jgi:hypothetical protein
MTTPDPAPTKCKVCGEPFGPLSEDIDPALSEALARIDKCATCAQMDLIKSSPDPAPSPDAEKQAKAMFDQWCGNSYEWDALTNLEQERWKRLSRAHAAERAQSPRIYTRCPACHNDTLTLNDDKHLLCTWYKCPDPCSIDHADTQIGALKAQQEGLLGRVLEEGNLFSESIELESNYNITASNVRTKLAKFIKRTFGITLTDLTGGQPQK